MKSFVFDDAGSRLRYLEFEGRGCPLIVIHGLGCASSFEYPHVALAPALKGRHIFLVDLPGFGYSDRPAHFGYRVEDHARVVARFVQEMNFVEVDLFGHSMGGSVAIEAADMLGSRVASLVLAEANLDSGGGEGSRNINGTSGGEGGYIESGHTLMLATQIDTGHHGYAATMRAAYPAAVYRSAKSLVDGTTPSWRARFLQHPAKKAYIFGDRSLPDPDKDVLAAEGIQVLIVQEAGHQMGLDNPVGLAVAIAQSIAPVSQVSMQAFTQV
ncbi:Alpha/Beta hydrolase protein [Xylariaceae sp. FL0016]|nr:Alpha/Beta hydrolase protein [Xylariaceae sp. FL0016]